MTTCYWNPNSQTIAEVVTCTVSAVPAGGGGTLVASINGKSITYTTVVGDTTTSAVSAWLTLLQNAASTFLESGEITWTSSANVLTATAAVPGTPFSGVTGNGLVFNATGGCTIVVATTQANVSPSDVANANNWIRGNNTGLPQNGDDVALQNSSVPLLWNLDALAGVRFNTFKRWQSFAAAVGLPEINPLGYIEWRQTYFQFSGPILGILSMQLGLNDFGSGPVRERYNVGSQQVTLDALNSAGAADAFAIRFLGTNPQNALRLVNTSLGVAMLPGEVAALASALVDGGGLIALGPGVTFGSLPTSSSVSGASSAAPGSGGSVILSSGQGILCSAPAVLKALLGSAVQILQGTTYPSVLAQGGSTLTWSSGANIGALTLQSGSVLDKSNDVQPMQIAQVTLDADTCTIRDPNNAITFTGTISYINGVNSGPIQRGPGGKIQVLT